MQGRGFASRVEQKVTWQVMDMEATTGTGLRIKDSLSINPSDGTPSLARPCVLLCGFGFYTGQRRMVLPSWVCDTHGKLMDMGTVMNTNMRKNIKLATEI
eukprot:Gb_01858 [translate_table: standard]